MDDAKRATASLTQIETSYDGTNWTTRHDGNIDLRQRPRHLVQRRYVRLRYTTDKLPAPLFSGILNNRTLSSSTWRHRPWGRSASPGLCGAHIGLSKTFTVEVSGDGATYTQVGGDRTAFEDSDPLFNVTTDPTAKFYEAFPRGDPLHSVGFLLSTSASGARTYIFGAISGQHILMVSASYGLDGEWNLLAAKATWPNSFALSLTASNASRHGSRR